MIVEVQKKTQILVTGSNGQLGQCINLLKQKNDHLEYQFTDASKLDITNYKNLLSIFKTNHFDYVINCAAYTNVERAEKEPDKAFLVNAEGVKNLAEICKIHTIILIHISTDYVFDGKKGKPYTEEDIPNPINEYGKSKLQGEKYIQEILDTYFIVRTSWLYSQFGKNFYKTILKKAETEKKLTIVNSEKGTPTNANDLASFIIYLIETKDKKFGIYHFSNKGEATWYEFAKEILRVSGKLKSIDLEKTDNYFTFANRPKYSVLSLEKSLNLMDLNQKEWKKSLIKL